MRRFTWWFAAVLVTLGVGACGDDDKPKSDADVTGDTSVSPDGDATTTEDDSATSDPDGDATTTGEETDTTNPQQTFAEYVIELVETQPDNTAPRPFAESSTLPDDQSPGAFDGVFD